MTVKDYYFILGISRNETAAGVHEAIRELAKRYHADIAGPESAEHFRISWKLTNIFRFAIEGPL
jgi:curved DNA-binding protein CbpA